MAHRAPVKAKKGLPATPTPTPAAPATPAPKAPALKAAAPTPPAPKVPAAPAAKKIVVNVPPSKHPLAAREHVGARDSGGKATRTDIRREAPRVSAPRASAKTAERGGQHRSNKAGKGK